VLLIEEAIKHLVHVDGLDLEAEAHVTAENRLLLPTHGPAAREELRTGAVIIDVVKAGTRVAEADMAWTGTTSPDLAALVHRIEQALQRAQAPHQTAPARIQMLLLDGTAGVFLHEVCGHLLESTWQRPSLVIDRIGDQIAHEQLHVDDEPLHAESFGAHRHTALGAKARRRSLIDAGNLVGLLADTPDGPWRAQDARHVPKPRMSNLTAAPACSDMPLDAALGSATTPVVRVHRLGTGSLDHRDGTILLEVKEATYQQGACTYRLAPFLVTAEARHLLMDIRAIGDAATLSTWSAYCLGASGSLPVSATVPVLLTGPVTTLPHRPLSPPRPAVIRH
jgi:predicted Zn-dependent protease